MFGTIQYASLKLWVASALMVIAVGGCSERNPMDPITTKMSAGVAPRERIRPAEAHMVQLAKAIPGFGGVYYDADGNLHALVTDLNRATQVREAVSALLTEKPFRFRQPNRTGRVLIDQGRFDFLALARWRDTLVLTVGRGLSGIYSFDLDEKGNRIMIGVKDQSTALAVAKLSQSLGIPGDAVATRLAEPSRDLTDSLTSLMIPAFAGNQIARQDFVGTWLCTIGFNTLNGTALVTNSHCTNFRGQEVNPTVFYQPLPSGYPLGQETNDPDYFNATLDCDCPTVQYRCRRSDAALISYASSVAPGLQGQGKIWKTTYTGTGQSQAGSIEISGSITITSEESNYTLLGIQLDKIGISSGWTSGSVVGTCVDVRSSADYWYLCQNLVSAYASAGDSGAPVFQYYSDPVFGNPSANLHGILRGWNIAAQAFEYSPLSAIYAELGYLPAIHP